MLTLNEEFNLPGAIESVKDWAEEIFIVDSCSTDRTVDIALENGVGIVQRHFTNFGDQWNFALQKLPIKTPWVLKLDADERISNELKDEIRSVFATDTKEDAFVVPVRLWFMGKPMHPKICVVRLWRKNKARISDVTVNEHLIVDGTTGRLRSFIEHHGSPDLHHWWDKQNRYTTMLAIQKMKGQKMSAEPKLFGTPLERHMFLIKLFFRLPFRYQIQWFYEVFVRGAWRDGKSGLTWVRLQITARRMRELKAIEMKTTGRIPELPKAPCGDYDPRVLASALQKSVCVEDNGSP
ncbi:MAG: glycosyltransferase family 2 protein [Pirellulales bacterium]|nr:glycosyltransferase family 2 protein [Pirellulales bacterium]